MRADPGHPDPRFPAFDAMVLLVKTESLDAIEARGWVVIGEAGPAATEQGMWWPNRWVRANRRVLGVPRGTRVEELTVRAKQ